MHHFIISYGIKSKGGCEFGVQASGCGWGYAAPGRLKRELQTCYPYMDF